MALLPCACGACCARCSSFLFSPLAKDQLAGKAGHTKKGEEAEELLCTLRVHRSGQVVVVSSHTKEIAEEVFSAKVLDVLSDVAYRCGQAKVS